MGRGETKRDDIVQELVKLKLEKKYSQVSLMNYLQHDKYNYEIAYAYQLIREAKDYIVSLYKEWSINALEDVLSDLANQKEQALLVDDKRLALDITKEENKLKGMYIDRIEHSGSVKVETIKLKEVFKKKDE